MEDGMDEIPVKKAAKSYGDTKTCKQRWIAEEIGTRALQQV